MEIQSTGKKAHHDKKWRCQTCHFDNYPLINSCEICDTPKSNINISDHKQTKAVIICHSKDCKRQNPLDIQFCLDCAYPLFEQKRVPVRSEKDRIGKNLINCKFCSFQNHKQNKRCLNCDKSLREKPLAYYGSDQCDGCGMIFGLDGRCACQKEQQQQMDSLPSSQICTFCDTLISAENVSSHSQICQKRMLFFDKNKNPSFDRCTELQKKTIIHMHITNQKKHRIYKRKILTKIRGMGYTQKDLENLHHYITHYAPIIVHMRAANFQFYTKDTHYRNAFEIHRTTHFGCGGRVQWEDRMFDQMHHKATPFQRVKYGTMNFTNDPVGVRVAQGYGLSYFLLKPHVRDRCTITDMDSASNTATIGTFRFVNQVLCKLMNEEIRSAFEGSKGNEMKSHVIHSYKQIQIHGPIQFSKDIERVYICKEEITPQVEPLVKQFCKKNNLECEYFNQKRIQHMFNNLKTKKNEQRYINK